MTRGKLYDDRDELALRAQLLWEIGDATTVEFSYDDYGNDFVGLVGESTVDQARASAVRGRARRGPAVRVRE